MSRSTIRLLYVLVDLGVAFWLVQSGGLSGDKRQIRRQLEEFRHLLEKESGEGAEIVERKKLRMGTLYTREFEFLLDTSESPRLITDRGALGEAYLAYYRGDDVDSIDVTFRNQVLELDPDLGKAEMQLEAVVTAAWKDSVYRGRDLWNLELSWEQEDGAWRLRRCQLATVESQAVRSLF